MRTEFIQCCIEACKNSYGIDYERFDAVTGSSYSEHQKLKAMRRKFRTSDIQRQSFIINEVKYKYLSVLSNDDIAVYVKLVRTGSTQIIIAYRGTDYDPFRYLGYLPDDYEGRLLRNSARYPHIESHFRCNAPYKPQPTAIERTSLEYCNLENVLNPIYRTNYHKSTGFTDHVVDFNKKRTNEFIKHSLAAGANDVYARAGSDCIADIKIGQIGTVPNPLKDQKHVEAVSKTHDIISKIIEYLSKKNISIDSITMTGHSLGGSLACLSYLRTAKERIVQETGRRRGIPCFFVGFNSAPLINYDSMIEKDHSTLDHMYHIRNRYDIVSAKTPVSSPVGVGRYIYTLSFDQPGDSRYTNVADSSVHGLDQFQCESIRLYETTNEFYPLVFPE